MDAIRLLSLEQETILSLISTVVSGAHDVRLKAEICWAKVMEVSASQGVQGICFDAL